MFSTFPVKWINTWVIEFFLSESKLKTLNNFVSLEQIGKSVTNGILSILDNRQIGR